VLGARVACFVVTAAFVGACDSGSSTPAPADVVDADPAVWSELLTRTEWPEAGEGSDVVLHPDAVLWKTDIEGRGGDFTLQSTGPIRLISVG
jgi:hypothetical protein